MGDVPAATIDPEAMPYSIAPITEQLARGGITHTVDLDGGRDSDPAVIVRRDGSTFYIEPAVDDDFVAAGVPPLFAVYRYACDDDRSEGVDEQSVEFVLAEHLVDAVDLPVVTVLVHLNVQVIAGTTVEAEAMARGLLRCHGIDDDLVADVEAI